MSGQIFFKDSYSDFWPSNSSQRLAVVVVVAAEESRAVIASAILPVALIAISAAPAVAIV
jgi:hypothetical protein